MSRRLAIWVRMSGFAASGAAGAAPASASTAARGSCRRGTIDTRASSLGGPPFDPGGVRRFGSRKASLSAARVMLRVELLHPLPRHVRVDLGGREVAVAEQHLHDAQVRSVVQEVRREGMAQRVRREVLL